MSVITDPIVSAAPNAPTDDSDLYAGRNETLALPDGRTLTYAHSGPPDSDLVVLWCHGLFCVGDARKPSKLSQDRHVRYIAPDLPGWGGTSPMPAGSTFPETFISDLRALFAHLYPTYDPATSKMHIYASGGSFGTCPAQIVFGAPYDKFPYGQSIVAVLLGAPLSPFHEDVHYSKSLTWRDWLGIGPPTQILPFNMLAHLTKAVFKPKVKDVPTAEKFLRSMFFKDMSEEEKARFAEWRARNGVEEGEFEHNMAEGMVKSVAKSWAGFLGTADAMHADWGFRIKDLDEHHAKKKVVIIVGKGDTSMYNMSRYLVEHYKNAQVVEVEGGHLAGAWSLDRIMEDLFAEVEDGRVPA